MFVPFALSVACKYQDALLLASVRNEPAFLLMLLSFCFDKDAYTRSQEPNYNLLTCADFKD